MEINTKKPIYTTTQTSSRDGLKDSPQTKCQKCTYARTGFVCSSTKEGTCLKDWRKGILRRSDSHDEG